MGHAHASAFFPEPDGYAWVITEDHISGPGDKSRVGVCGPRTATPEMIERARTEGREWRTRDDDGELYYCGRIWIDPTDAANEAEFGPLDDFAGPDAGATEIEYKNNNGEWEGL